MIVPQGIHPVRQPCPLARRAPSGGEGFDGLRGTGGAGPVHMPASGVLLRVAGPPRLTGRRVRAPQACAGCTVGGAVGMVAPRLVLPRGAAAQGAGAPPPPERAPPGGGAQRDEPP